MQQVQPDLIDTMSNAGLDSFETVRDARRRRHGLAAASRAKTRTASSRESKAASKYASMLLSVQELAAALDA
jgi:hypothetical protein